MRQKNQIFCAKFEKLMKENQTKNFAAKFAAERRTFLFILQKALGLWLRLTNPNYEVIFIVRRDPCFFQDF